MNEKSNKKRSRIIKSKRLRALCVFLSLCFVLLLIQIVLKGSDFLSLEFSGRTASAKKTSYNSKLTAIGRTGDGLDIMNPQTAILTVVNANTSERIEGAQFKLQYFVDSQWVDYSSTIKYSDSDGKLKFTDLAPNTYRLIELKAATEYDVSSATYSPSQVFKISENDTWSKEITVANKKSDIEIKVKKIWDDYDNEVNVRPSSVTITLKADGTVIRSATLTSENALISENGIKDENVWEYTFTGLPVYDGSNAVTYTIEENEITNYKQKIDGYIVTDTISLPHTVKLAATDYNTGSFIVGAQFKLQYYSGTAWIDYSLDDHIVINETDSDGNLEFRDLPSGRYRFVETTASDGYNINSAEYSEEEFVISPTDTSDREITVTNRLLDKFITVRVLWNDYNNEANVRPETITIKLMKDNTEIKSADLTSYYAVTLSDGSASSSEWEYTFTDLPIYDGDTDNVIKYTISGDDVIHYVSNTDLGKYTIAYGLNLTHTAKLILTDYNTGSPIEGAVFKLQYLSEAEWTDYPANEEAVTKVTDAKGIIEYTDLTSGTYRFEELEVPDAYDIESAVYSEQSFIILPTATASKNVSVTNQVFKKDITVRQIWTDGNNPDNVRPSLIRITLFAGDSEVAAAELSKDNMAEDSNIWEYIFKDLAVYNQKTNEMINYTLKAEAIDGYDSIIDGYTINSKLKPNKVNIAQTIKYGNTDSDEKLQNQTEDNANEQKTIDSYSDSSSGSNDEANGISINVASNGTNASSDVSDTHYLPMINDNSSVLSDDSSQNLINFNEYIYINTRPDYGLSENGGSLIKAMSNAKPSNSKYVPSKKTSSGDKMIETLLFMLLILFSIEFIYGVFYRKKDDEE